MSSGPLATRNRLLFFGKGSDGRQMSESRTQTPVAETTLPSGMPVASSRYWNAVHGREKGQAELDLEGLQTMRTLAKNMTFLMKSIALGKEQYGLPEKEEFQPTHFIR